MLLPSIVLVVLVVALLRGGNIQNFATLKLRWLPLVFASLGIQLLIFTPFVETPIIPVATTQLYLLSMLILCGWVAANWRTPGMGLIAAGLLCNTLAIAANGGYMPTTPEAASMAGNIPRHQQSERGVSNNSLLANREDIQLWPLTDIFAIPAGLPFANVFSVGDILLVIGTSMLCYKTAHNTPIKVMQTEPS